MYPSYPQPLPRKSSVPKIVLIVLGVLALVCGGGAVACAALLTKATSDVASQAANKKTDVSIKAGSCKANQFGGYEVTVIIVNSADTAKSYWVQVNLVSADDKTRLGEAHAVANDLNSGATQEVQTVGNASGFPPGAKCVIGDVT